MRRINLKMRRKRSMRAANRRHMPVWWRRPTRQVRHLKVGTLAGCWSRGGRSMLKVGCIPCGFRSFLQRTADSEAGFVQDVGVNLGGDEKGVTGGWLMGPQGVMISVEMRRSGVEQGGASRVGPAEGMAGLMVRCGTCFPRWWRRMFFVPGSVKRPSAGISPWSAGRRRWR